MAKKRSREEGNVDVQLVEIYEDLASDSDSVRLTAAKSLISKLKAEPEIHEKVIRRLFRGLASGRKSARVGFSVVLTEILRKWNEVLGTKSDMTIASVIDLLESSTKIGNDAKGQESRDHYLGRLFGAGLIVQSGVLFADDQNVLLWDRLVILMFESSKRKVWLRESCGWILHKAIDTLKLSPAGDEYVRRLLKYIEANAQAKTPEGVTIWIAVQQKFPNLKLPKGIFRHQDPLNRKEKSTLARILKQSSAADQTNGATPETKKGTTTGAWSSKPHFAWDVVFSAVMAPEKKQVTFAELWEAAVDESLFSLKSSPERKYWGFLLFQKYIFSAPTDVIPHLFGPNLLGTLKFQLRSDEQALNAMAVDVVDSIVARSVEDPGTVPVLVDGFLAADINFDRFAKSKPIEKLIGRANLRSLEDIVNRLVFEIKKRTEKMTGQPEDEDLHGLTSLADLLVSIFRSHNFPDKEDPSLDEYRHLVEIALATLVREGYGGAKTSNATQAMFQQRVMSSMNHITAKDPQPAYHPFRAIAMLRDISKIELDAEPQVVEAIEKGCRLLEKVQAKEKRGKNTERTKTLQAFELLLAFALLQAYSGEAESINTIDDLQNCYRSLIQDKSTASEEEDAVALIEIIVEFVSKPSALYRRLAPKILSAFSSRVTEDGLDVMLKVLHTTENTSGQAELFANGEEDGMDEDDEDDEDGSSDGSVDSDVEVVDADDASEASEAEDTGSDGSAASESPDAADAELQAFNAQLAAALGTHQAHGGANGDAAADDDSASDSDMSDGAMEALDGQLGAIFKQRLVAGRNATPKQQRRGARDTIVNFKTKILELLEAYVKQEHLAPAALHLVAPLLRSMHATSSPQIANKSCELVRLFTRLYKLQAIGQEGYTGDPKQRGAAFALLEDVHALIRESTSAMQAKACSSASLLATKVYLSHGGKLEEVNPMYSDTSDSLATEGEYKFRQCFMEDWRNWQTQAQKNGQLKGR